MSTPEPSFPVQLVAPDGALAQADSRGELEELSVHGYRLRRATPGVNLAVAEAPAAGPREITRRRAPQHDEPAQTAALSSPPGGTNAKPAASKA